MKMYKKVKLGYNCYSTIPGHLSNVCILQKYLYFQTTTNIIKT